MAEVHKGDKYKCEDCGIVVVVDDPCGCTACDLVCCGAPMVEVKPKSKPKTKAKAKPKPKKKTKKKPTKKAAAKAKPKAMKKKKVKK